MKKNIPFSLVTILVLVYTQIAVTSSDVSSYDPMADVNRDGIVDANDLYRLGQACMHAPESSSSPSSFIDHLPFTINKTGVYCVVEDLTVNGDGITILANGTVLVGLGHTITGDGTGMGVNVSAFDVVITGLRIKNFEAGIVTWEGPYDGWIHYERCKIFCNVILDNFWGVLLLTDCNYVFSNIIANNLVGVQPESGFYNKISNNYFRNDYNGHTPNDETNYWNTTRSTGHNIISGPYIGGNYWHDYDGEDLDEDGIGETPYTIFGGTNKDYLPLVDIVAPQYRLTTVDSTLADTTLYVTWKDHVQVDKVILEFDGVNYTDVEKTNESLGFDEWYLHAYTHVEHSITCTKTFISLPLGDHYYRWFANDTSGLWNSTELLSFSVIALPQIESVGISPILEVRTNVTCEGVSNITERMDYANLHFKTDNNCYIMNMSYNSETAMYSALLPVYNQLANKTIEYYVVAGDKFGNIVVSEVYAYTPPVWIKADLDRDGDVDTDDLYILAQNYGES